VSGVRPLYPLGLSEDMVDRAAKVLLADHQRKYGAKHLSYRYFRHLASEALVAALTDTRWEDY